MRQDSIAVQRILTCWSVGPRSAFACTPAFDPSSLFLSIDMAPDDAVAAPEEHPYPYDRIVVAGLPATAEAGCLPVVRSAEVQAVAHVSRIPVSMCPISRGHIAGRTRHGSHMSPVPYRSPWTHRGSQAIQPGRDPARVPHAHLWLDKEVTVA